MRPRARRWVSVVIVEHRIKLHQSGIEHGFKSGLELVVVRPVVRGHRGLGVVGGWEGCCCTPGKWFGGAGRVQNCGMHHVGRRRFTCLPGVRGADADVTLAGFDERESATCSWPWAKTGEGR